jgi:serine/threonine protein kinase
MNSWAAWVESLHGPAELMERFIQARQLFTFRATDTTLGRQVALKILPETVASHPERIARFEREAKTLAALNHPNIAAIYGVEKSSSAFALVMELVEGEDLLHRIARGAIPADEALPIAKQIAEALEAAHDQGIIHRDLKPANIKVRPDGTVKVLDFGLAKALDQSPASSPQTPAPGLSMSPTITSPAMTAMGIILGTAAYMAPEQAKGKSADKRADIWAFGVLLYEMLTGHRAFTGDDVSDVPWQCWQGRKSECAAGRHAAAAPRARPRLSGPRSTAAPARHRGRAHHPRQDHRRRARGRSRERCAICRCAGVVARPAVGTRLRSRDGCGGDADLVGSVARGKTRRSTARSPERSLRRRGDPASGV